MRWLALTALGKLGFGEANSDSTSPGEVGGSTIPDRMRPAAARCRTAKCSVPQANPQSVRQVSGRGLQAVHSLVQSRDWLHRSRSVCAETGHCGATLSGCILGAQLHLIFCVRLQPDKRARSKRGLNANEPLLGARLPNAYNVGNLRCNVHLHPIATHLFRRPWQTYGVRFSVPNHRRFGAFHSPSISHADITRGIRESVVTAII